MHKNMKEKRIFERKILSTMLILMIFLNLSSVAQATPTVTTCTSGFLGSDIAINSISPYDAFIPSGSVVKHVSSVSSGSGPCTFGTITDIQLPSGMSASRGAALDNSGNLYVTAGSDDSSTNNIIVIPPPYTTPTTFYNGGTNFKSLAIYGSKLYVADFGAGKIIRFDLSVGASSATTFANVPGVFGLFAAGTDDLFVTSNSMGLVEHVTTSGVDTISTGLSYPEGIGGDSSNLYIAAAGKIYVFWISTLGTGLYVDSPILWSHGVTIWEGAGYATDSHDLGEVHKFTLISTPTTTPTPTPTPVPTQCKILSNTFYPGINWATKDLGQLGQTASNLDSKLMHSYENTDILSGSLHTYLAYKEIGTIENYLVINDQPFDGGYHPIVFAHSGGTQSLIKLIERGEVTADYAVLAAPALLNEDQLTKLIKDKKIKKKIIIFQSEQDILFNLDMRISREYELSARQGILSYGSNGLPVVIKNAGEKFPAIEILSEIKPSDLFKPSDAKVVSRALKLAFGIDDLQYWPIDVTNLLTKYRIDKNWIPETDKFWIGGANRNEQELFKDVDVDGDGSPDIIAISLSYPKKTMIDVHHELLKEMKTRFSSGKYPFNGNIDGLERCKPR